MRRKKLIYIVSDIDKSLHFEWIAPALKAEFQLSFILIGKSGSALEAFLNHQGIPVFFIAYSRKAQLFQVWLSVLRVLLRQRPAIIHTHLWIANLVGLTAGWIAGVRKRIYTRHHATIHYKEYPSGLKWDRLNNKLATHIIAISRNVEEILLCRDKAQKKKVTLIYHGFDFRYFQHVTRDRIEAIYTKYGIRSDQGPVVGVISRFTEWKGVQYVIPAFKKLRSFFPNAHLVLANARGSYAKSIGNLLVTLPAEAYTTITFENDLAALYKLFDIFVHVPVDKDSEAFGQTYIEPLIAGVPCVFTLSGIGNEIIKHEKNALVVPYRNSEEICASMNRILTEPDLRRKLLINGYESARDFTMEKYLRNLKELYLA